MDSCGEYFLFYGLTDFMFFLVLAWRYGSFLSKILYVFLYPESWLQIRSPRPVSKELIFFFPTSADGRSSHFRLRVLANHFGFYLLPSPGEAIRVRSQSTDSLTHILYFLRQAMRNWPILLSCLNGHSFGWPANSNTEGLGTFFFSPLSVGDHVTITSWDHPHYLAVFIYFHLGSEEVILKFWGEFLIYINALYRMEINL